MDFSTRIARRLLDEDQLASEVTLLVSQRIAMLNSHIISIHPTQMMDYMVYLY